MKGSLQPGTSHLFRIRAFNGFGHGEYTYKILTTTPSQLPCPRTTRYSLPFIDDPPHRLDSSHNHYSNHIESLRRLTPLTNLIGLSQPKKKEEEKTDPIFNNPL